MSLPDAKALKKLAKACRDAGIKTFKNAEFELTLTDEAPVSNYKRKQETSRNNELSGPSIDETFKGETLSEEQLMFYSVMDPVAGESIEESA